MCQSLRGTKQSHTYMQLLQHFKELTIHPKNAEELKGLILQLAVQGKLTADWRTNNPNVEKASDNLERIKAEKKLQIVKESEFPFRLNSSWEWAKFIDVAELRHGHQFRKYDFVEDGIPVIKIGQCKSDGTLDFSKCNYIDSSRKDEFENDLIFKGHLLMALTGGTLGKVTRVDKDYGVLVQNYRVGNFFADERVITLDFLNVILESELFQSLVREKINQNAQPNIGKDSIEKIVMPIPPLEEQKEIVKVVETLFKEVEQLEQATVKRIGLKEDFVTSALHQLTTNNAKREWSFLQEHFKSFFDETTNIKKLRETVLQLAVQGKLTADWRQQKFLSGAEVEDASQLLKRIQEEKAQLIKEKKIKKEKPLPPITKEEIPYELPDGWVWCRLQDLVNVGTGSTPAKSNSSYYDGIIPWYTSSATNDLYAKESEKLITEKALQETNCKVFPKGTLIIAMYGQGKTRGQISELVIPGATNQAVAAMVFYKTSKEFKEYIKYFFRKIYDEIRLLAEGGAQPNLNVGKIKNTILPLPPLEEQKAIVEKVNALMGLCDKLEQEVQQSQEHSEQLMQSVLREVFEGEKRELV